MIAGLVLAGGAGRRFGPDVKQLALLDGRPLLEHALRAMLAAPGLDAVAVVLGAHAEQVRAGVDLSGARVVVTEDWAEGQAASLRAGVRALAGAEALVVAVGDQPGLSPAAVAAVLAARAPGIEAVRATYDGAPGHPVLLERALLARVGELRGDVGARALLAGATVRDVDCTGLGDPHDVDTPADLAPRRAAGGVGTSGCRS